MGAPPCSIPLSGNNCRSFTKAGKTKQHVPKLFLQKAERNLLNMCCQYMPYASYSYTFVYGHPSHIGNPWAHHPYGPYYCWDDPIHSQQFGSWSIYWDHYGYMMGISYGYIMDIWWVYGYIYGILWDHIIGFIFIWFNGHINPYENGLMTIPPKTQSRTKIRLTQNLPAWEWRPSPVASQFDPSNNYGWVADLPLWKIWFRQLGWFFPWKNKTCSKPPTRLSININDTTPRTHGHFGNLQTMM